MISACSCIYEPTWASAWVGLFLCSAFCRALFLFLGSKLSLNCPFGVLSDQALKWDNYVMEIYERLEQIGVEPEAVEAIRADDDKENALLLIALWDDRHEYLD